MDCSQSLQIHRTNSVYGPKFINSLVFAQVNGYCFRNVFKATRLQIHANCRENFENVFECVIL
jgi:hypothetical protein